MGAALHLEHPDGVGGAEHVVDGGVGEVELGDVDLDAFVLGDEVDGVVDRGEHAEAEQVELDQSDLGAVVLVPLQHGAVGHAGVLDGDDFGDGAVADDHAAGVDAEVPWCVADLVRQREDIGGDGVFLVGGDLGDRAPAVDLFGPGVLLAGRVAQALWPCRGRRSGRGR